MVTKKREAEKPKMSGKSAGNENKTPIEQKNMDQQTNMIAEAAYYRAEIREFAPGHEMEDWLEAEKEITKGSDNS